MPKCLRERVFERERESRDFCLLEKNIDSLLLCSITEDHTHMEIRRRSHVEKRASTTFSRTTFLLDIDKVRCGGDRWRPCGM